MWRKKGVVHLERVVPPVTLVGGHFVRVVQPHYWVGGVLWDSACIEGM